jgi:hypothetical protein
MEIFEKKIIDMVEIIQTTGVIQIRCIKQKWVRSGDQEMLVEPNVGLHRYALNPGDWAGADAIGVRSYADAAWSPEVIARWQASFQDSMQKLWARAGSDL